MAALSIKINDEVYIYINGKLTMKRWVGQKRSVIFDVATYDKHTLTSITEENGVIKTTKR